MRRAAYCKEVLKLGHETVPCNIDDPDHEPPHRNDIFGCWPPCSNCGGLDSHSPKCSNPIQDGRAHTWAVVEWSENMKTRVTCGSRRW